MKYSVFLALLALGACSQPTPQTTAAAATPPSLAALLPDTINTPKAKQLLAQPATQVLDVRTPAEYLLGHLPQAQNLNVNADDFSQQIARLDTAKTYVLYCRSGKRSAKALDTMRVHGFRHLVNGGGYDDVK